MTNKQYAKFIFWCLIAGVLMISAGQFLPGQPMVPKGTGQQAVTGSAVALPVQTVGVVCLKAVPANTIPVYVGFISTVTTSTGYPLSASESYCTQVSNLNTFYVIATTTGASIAWATSNNSGQ